MSTQPTDPNPRVFHCHHCNGKIKIPQDLPPTTAPCPHCGQATTSPPLELSIAPVRTSVDPTSPPPAPPAIQPVIQPRAEAPAPIAVNRPRSKPPSESRPLAPLILIFGALILAAAATLFYVSKEMRRTPEPRPVDSVTSEEIRESKYLQDGWQEDAYQVLSQFIAAETTEEKLKHIFAPSTRTDRLRQFYGDQRIDDTGTPAESFTVQELQLEDRKRGIFLLTYDQPPQFRMRDFFRPLAPLEVQWELEEADLLLTTMSRLSNFAMEPLRIQAFFKRTPAGLKLDWDIFIQTKFRTLWEFINNPQPGQAAVFRVVASEDVPAQGRDVPGYRTYRLTDPANHGDSVRVSLAVDSEIGGILSAINWRGTQDGTPIARTATVELAWDQAETPSIILQRFICWEFLGLGGEEPSSATPPR